MPRLLSEKPWELVLRFSEPPTPSVITVKRIWKKFGPEPDTPLLPRKEAVSEKPGMPASPLLAAALPMKKTIDASSANTTLAPRPMPRLAPMVFMDCGVVSAVMVGSAAGRAICWVGWLGCGAAAGRGRGWRILELLRSARPVVPPFALPAPERSAVLAPPVAVWAAGRWFLRSCRCGAIGQRTAAVGICGAGAMCGAEDSMVPSSDSGAAGAAVPPRSFG